VSDLVPIDHHALRELAELERIDHLFVELDGLHRWRRGYWSKFHFWPSREVLRKYDRIRELERALRDSWFDRGRRILFLAKRGTGLPPLIEPRMERDFGDFGD
jgi:hypothetical protein